MRIITKPLEQVSLVEPWRFPQRGIACVYYLFREGLLVYVGVSEDMRARMRAHQFRGKWDAIGWTEVSSEDRYEIEKKEIERLSPPWNDGGRKGCKISKRCLAKARWAKQKEGAATISD